MRLMFLTSHQALGLTAAEERRRCVCRSVASGRFLAGLRLPPEERGELVTLLLRTRGHDAHNSRAGLAGQRLFQYDTSFDAVRHGLFSPLRKCAFGSREGSR